MGRKRKALAAFGALLAALLLPKVSAEAAQTIYNSPYVSFAPDGKAWTTNAEDRNIRWYGRGQRVSTGIASTLCAPGTGEHYYTWERMGMVPVGYWEVEWAEGQCIHNDYPAEETYHGVPFSRNNCFTRHYSGWLAYCADCGEKVEDCLIYMSREAAESIDYLRLGEGFDYYSLCPFCRNLEQGYPMNRHFCKAVSVNRYRVRYEQNEDSVAYYGAVRGYMEDSVHMYNNAAVYEGEEVTPATHLSPCTYLRTGYVFAGWNTAADGSGIAYADGAEILNLTAENWDGGTDDMTGTVVLYAQWRPAEGTLRIDPAGGSYAGNPGITAITQRYGTSYTPENALLTAPAGYRVRFEAGGGVCVDSVLSGMHFAEWAMEQPFKGYFAGGRYEFTAPNGNADILRAVWEPDSVVLPQPQREGCSFGGWYYDAAFEHPAGGAGDRITPAADLTLYAQWVELVLQSADNYTAYGGSGAVDLSWGQADGQGKTYLLWQSLNAGMTDRKKISSAEDVGTVISVSKDFGYTGSVQTYTVPHSGIYTASLSGAQGSGYEGISGGRGGSVSLRLWLEKDELLTVTAGGSNGYNGGGIGCLYGNGGGMTTLSSDKKGLIAVAGGGGAASPMGGGGAGGSQASLTGDGNGGNGAAGGGGGYQGGSAGENIVHHHTPDCYVSGTKTADRYFYDNHAGNMVGNELSATISSGAESVTIEGTTFASHGAQESIIQAGDNLRYFVTPYSGTLTIDYSTATWGDLEGIQPTFTLYCVHEDGTVSSQSCRIMSLGPTSPIDWDDENGVTQWIHWDGRYVNAGYTTESDFGTIKRINDIKDTVTKPCGSTRDRWCPHYEVIGEHFEGRIGLGYGVMWVCSQPACSSDPYHGVNPFYTINGKWKFEIPEDVRGIYCSQQEKYFGNAINVNHTIGKITYSYSALQCGYEEGEVISSRPAYGGSSYVNTAAVLSCEMTAGDRVGDGFASLRSESTGYTEEHEMKKVKAKDLAAPDAVDSAGMVLQPAGTGQIRISWQKPADNGTAYYHQAESCLQGTAALLCRSNITENTLTSGVKGYYYRIDTNPGTAAGVGAAFLGGGGETTSLTVDTTESVRYLHLAAVDVAGNVGPTTHIRLDAESVRWSLYTRQLQIGNGENIYAAGHKTYYVRCDGATPFLLTHTAYMDGQPTAGYQLNYSIYETAVRGRTDANGGNRIYTPSAAVVGAAEEIRADRLSYRVEGVPLLRLAQYSLTARQDNGKTLQAQQKFTLDTGMHGKVLEVTPRAGAVYRGNGEEEIYYSDAAADAGNGIILIGDCAGPSISGLEELGEREFINRIEDSVTVTVTAADDLSGVADFYLKITNQDNFSEQSFYPENGRITVDITKAEPLFSGDFTVTAHAADNVGNVTRVSYSVTELALEARIERILEPHDPVFKRGESGMLYVTTYGYADRVEITFPRAMQELDERLRGTIVFGASELSHEYQQESEVQFMIPLYLPEDGEYVIMVRAYRDANVVETFPGMTVTSEGGSVLDEFRTRLR